MMPVKHVAAHLRPVVLSLHHYGRYLRVMYPAMSCRMTSSSPSTPQLSQAVPAALLAKTDSRAKVSKAMRMYMERAQAHNLFMKQQSQEYEIGRRHLANMMGQDAESFSQNDIDDAIAYLLPSNLAVKSARPVMKPPEQIYPAQKEAQFGLDGRPFSPFFYTLLPNYYQTLHDIYQWTEQLNALEDERIRRGKVPPDKHLDLKGTEWKSKQEMRAIFLEAVNDQNYRQLMLALERFTAHPYSYRTQQFVMNFRKNLVAVTAEHTVPEVKTDEEGRKFVEVYGTRKSAHAWILMKEGSGKLDINGQDILYFPRMQDRRQVMFPFQFTDNLFKFDLLVKLMHGEPGGSAQAGALREAISKGLTAFVDEEQIEFMRQAGLLTHDLRIKERKKYGFTGARSKPKWRKR